MTEETALEAFNRTADLEETFRRDKIAPAVASLKTATIAYEFEIAVTQRLLDLDIPFAHRHGQQLYLNAAKAAYDAAKEHDHQMRGLAKLSRYDYDYFAPPTPEGTDT